MRNLRHNAPSFDLNEGKVSSIHITLNNILLLLFKDFEDWEKDEINLIPENVNTQREQLTTIILSL